MSTSINENALDLLFDKPLEPIIGNTKNDGAELFIPKSYYTPEFEELANEKQAIEDDLILSRPANIPIMNTVIGGGAASAVATQSVNIDGLLGVIGGQLAPTDSCDKKIRLIKFENNPDWEFTKPLGKKQEFSLNNELHRNIAGRLTGIFMDAKNCAEFLSLATFYRDRVNAYLFQYCFTTAILHRNDTKNYEMKRIAEIFPHNFIEPSAFKEARVHGNLIKDAAKRKPVNIPRNYTASDREEEQRLSYFREDIGVNSHHWHWHIVYPGFDDQNGERFVKKDRRGELFYYMHHQILARYNIERFCNNLSRVKAFNNFYQSIAEGYFPKMLSSVNNRTFAPRAANAVLRDVDRHDIKLEIADLHRWTNRIIGAIDQGYAIDKDGNRVSLQNEKGIDILGDMVEPSQLSQNLRYYGRLHNEGHNALALCHDPDSRFLEDVGIMGNVTTAMRDPIFYRWHYFIDNIFTRHKDTLDHYTADQLGLENIAITSMEVTCESDHPKLKNELAKNKLLTYWDTSLINLNSGLDFGPTGDNFAKVTHLQYQDFEYRFKIRNNADVVKRGTCRIFLFPKSDERGTELHLNEQRLLAVEMDRFTVTLNPGTTPITRHSKESTVTIPFKLTFSSLHRNNKSRLSQFCSCGWPDHMLLPKGKAGGMTFDLFVMISDYMEDIVRQTNTDMDKCNDASSFCGLKDKKYPDNRAMGFPFDRRFEKSMEFLRQLPEKYSNMKIHEIRIKHLDEVIEGTKTDDE